MGHIIIKPAVNRQHGQQARRIVNIKQPNIVRKPAPPTQIVSAADRLRDFVKPTIVIKPQSRQQDIKNNGVMIDRTPRSIRPGRSSLPVNKRGPVVKRITSDVPEKDIKAIVKLKDTCKNRILVIMGNGPSLAEVDTSKLVGLDYVDTLIVNKPDERCWPTTYWVFFDASQYQRNKDKWDNYNGIAFVSNAIKVERPRSIKLKNVASGGFQRDLSKGVHIGRSSVYASMQIGMWLGYQRIYILGCDMVDVAGKVHYYGVNPDVNPEERKKRFDGEAKFYADATKSLSEAERNNIIFCSSYLKYQFANKYQKIDHKFAVEFITQDSIKLRSLHDANQIVESMK